MEDEELEWVAELAAVLSNPKRLRIALNLADGPKTLKQLHSSQSKLKYRDSTYRHAEKLLEAGMVEKYYDQDEKEMRYKLTYESITFKFTGKDDVIELSDSDKKTSND